MLPVGVRRDQRLELRDDVDVAPELELCVDQLLPYCRLPLDEPCDCRLGKRLEGQVGEWRPAKERQRLAEELRPPVGRLSSRLRDQSLETKDVDLVGLRLEQVAGSAR